MSDLAKRIDVHANAGLLIQQWQQAPRMRALVDALQGVMDDHLVKPLADMEERLRIDTAEGFWLDCIGERLMLPRPATDIANFASFGFHGSDGVGFDQGPFATVVEALSTRLPVGDEFYRKLLMMRAEALLADGTVERLSDAVGHVFPGVSYRDGGDMTADVQGAYQGLDSRSLLEALDIAGGLPSPAGVELSRVVWEYVVGGDCEGDEPPVVAGHTSSHTNVSEYERSDEQAHSGNHSWKITVAQGASDSASVFIGFNVAYADLLPMTQITFSAWVYVPASIIEAPSSTKNRAGERDPEMHQTKKGNEWRFGMKVHVGADAETGVVHSMTTTPANVHDVTEAHRLLHGGEKRVGGDAGYQRVDKRLENRELDVEWRVAMRPGRRRHLEPGSYEALAEKRKASVRAKVEHPFLYVKRRFGYAKVRYRGLAKNAQRLALLLGLANLMTAERRLAT